MNKHQFSPLQNRSFAVNKNAMVGSVRTSIFLALVFVSTIVSAQISRLQVKVVNSASFPSGSQGSSGLVTNASSLNSILSSYGVTSFSPAYPSAWRSELPASSCADLKNYYVIKVSTSNAAALKSSIQSCSACGCSEVTIMREPVLAYSPNDYNIQGDINGAWYLDKIGAKDAWDISKGNGIKIAIIDQGFDVSHADFGGGKYYYSQFNPWTTDPVHGTRAASIAAGRTDDGVGTSSIGFNARLGFYDVTGMGEAVLAAAADGADIISISVLATNADDIGYQKAVNIAYQKGCFIVAAAGNGFGTNPNGPDVLEYPASFDNVFSVTGVLSDDTHRPSTNPDNGTFQHNSNVDLCAPAYHIWSATAGGGYAQGDGTSWAAPMVAGTVALMKSANPCLTNAEIESILKSTSDEIYSKGDNWKYAGKLGAGRLNAFKAVQMAKSMGDLIVTGNTTISNANVVYSNILVKRGGTLSIQNSVVNLKKDGKIMVEAGARLFVSSQSKLRSLPPIVGSLCQKEEYLWHGIIVGGDPILDQASNNQGFVSISNSTIQNASNAISTFWLDANGNVDYSKTGGGIIQCGNVVFRNNGRHVEFASYHAPNTSAGEANNRSKFTGCKFFVDNSSAALFPSGGNRVMVTLFDVKGVRFTGCTFANDFDNTGNNKGTGILALDASLIIENDKVNGGGRNLFQNLEYGIRSAYSPYSNKLIWINNSDFLANRFGLLLSEGLSSTLYRNNFDLRNTTFSSTLNPIGLQLLNSSNFAITENKFVEGLKMGADNKYSLNKFGCEMRSSDRYSGAIPGLYARYTLNSHEDIKTATSTEGNNQMLEVTCNAYKNSIYALALNYLTHNHAKLIPEFGSCAQKRLDYNNTFNRNLIWVGTEYRGSNDIFDHTGSGKEYVVKSTLPMRPEDYYCLFVDVTNCNDAASVTAFECTPIVKPEPATGNQFFDNWNPTDKKTRYTEIRQEIPGYPSEVTLPSIDDFEKYKQLAKVRGDIVYGYNNLMLFDEDENQHYGNYVRFLAEDGTSESKKMLVATYYSYTDYINAQLVLNTIPSESDENKAFIQYYSIMLNLKQEGKSVYQMNEEQHQTMRVIATGTTLTSASAQGVLALVYGEEFDHTPMAPTPDGSNEGQSSESTGISSNSLLVYPNPALVGETSRLVVDYNIVGNYTNAGLKLVNNLGEVVSSLDIMEAKGQKEIDINSLQAGIYVVQLFVDNAVVSYKLFNLVP